MPTTFVKPVSLGHPMTDFLFSWAFPAPLKPLPHKGRGAAVALVWGGFHCPASLHAVGVFFLSMEVSIMQILNTVRRLSSSAAAKAAAVGTTLTLAAGQVMAAVPAEVTAAVNDAKTDGAVVATGFVVAVVVIKALGLMKRA